jgi:hypothetical protein
MAQRTHSTAWLVFEHQAMDGALVDPMNGALQQRSALNGQLTQGPIAVRKWTLSGPTGRVDCNQTNSPANLT